MSQRRTLRVCLAPVTLVFLGNLMLSTPVLAQSPPTLDSARFFGGANDQWGYGLVVRGPGIYVAGVGDGGVGPLVRWSVPPGPSPTWSDVQGSFSYLGLSHPGATIFPVGAAFPPKCGASDGVGGTESKVGAGRLTTAGAFLGCSSANYFSYRGGEAWLAALDVTEGLDNVVYTAGNGENCGFGHNVMILGKYNDAAVLIDSATELGSGGCIGFSSGFGLAELGGFIYVAGHSGLPGNAEDGGFPTGLTRPVLLKYDSALNRMWKARPGESAGFFRGVATLGGNVFAVGNTHTPIPGRDPIPTPTTADFLVEKYDTSGMRQCRAVTGGGDDDVLNGVVAIGSRLFAVGYTRSTGAGGADVAILEIDPDDCTTTSTTLYGDAQDDFGEEAATDGTDLYVAGESASFASPEGNLVGRLDMMLLRYRLNQPPTADAGDDREENAGPACTANVTLDGADSSDPDPADTLTYTWTGSFGTAHGPSPTVTLSLGPHTIGLTVDDGHGGTDSDSVEVTVVDETGPTIGSATASPPRLSPPNHAMIPVTVGVSATDNCAGTPSCAITAVTSNEPVNGLGDGDLAPDWMITGPLSLNLRSERSGKGSGRVYTIALACEDAANNTSSAPVSVVVPKKP